MDLTQLYYFKIIAKHEHLTKASKELLITQPALSRNLSKLENELGVQLFLREGRNLKLNNYGKILLKHTDRILQELSEIPLSLQKEQRKEREVLYIGSSNSALSTPWLAEFHKAHPHITLRHKTFEEEAIYTELASNHINFAITMRPPKESYLKSLKLFSDAYYVLVGQNHPLNAVDSLYFHECKGLSFIALPQSEPSNRFIDDLAEKSGERPNIVFEGESEFLTRYLLDTEAATIILKSSFQEIDTFLPHRFHPIALKDSFAKFDVFCTWKANRENEATYQSFIPFLKTLQKAKGKANWGIPKLND